MSYYIVEDTHGDWDNIFLIKANNKKEALNILWEQMGYNNQESEKISGYKPHYKKEFTVTRLTENLLRENNNCITLH